MTTATTMNYNTTPELWEAYAKAKPNHSPLIIRAGHVYDKLECLARFNDSATAKEVLTLAGVRNETPTKTRYVIHHHPGFVTEIHVEFDTGYKYVCENRLTWAVSRDTCRQAVEVCKVECVIERPDRYTEVFPWLTFKQEA